MEISSRSSQRDGIRSGIDEKLGDSLNPLLLIECSE
jgi:hypothetical protein